jgi:hypothetical protein
LLIVGALGLAVGLAEVHLEPRRALFAYAAGFAASVSVAVGSLLFIAIAHTARARWFVALRRVAGALASTLPLFPVLFLPIALGVRTLYPWAEPSTLASAADRAWAKHAHAWLDVRFFVVRGYVYLIAWSVLAVVLRHVSVAGDSHPRAALIRRERRVSAAAIPVLAVTLTGASYDWLMSLNPRWSSDMMGVYFFAAAFSGTMAATAIGAWLAWRARRLPASVGADHFHALGRVLFVSIVFWAYIAFCQFVLVWIVDVDRESAFYLDRARGAWGLFTAVLGACHFAFPFLLLLSRRFKRSPGLVAFAGGWVLLGHALDVYWLVLPGARAGMRWLDTGFVVGIAAVVAGAAVSLFLSASPVPIHDPALAESLRYESP